MQLLNANSTNHLYFTATENMVSGDWCYLNIHHVSSNTDFFYAFEKATNISPFTSRYDCWDVVIGNIPNGQCVYTLYEGNQGATQATSQEVLRLLEVGLYEVLTSEQTDIVFSTNNVTYIEPNL